jgi:hypothetical protein
MQPIVGGNRSGVLEKWVEIPEKGFNQKLAVKKSGPWGDEKK